MHRLLLYSIAYCVFVCVVFVEARVLNLYF